MGIAAIVVFVIIAKAFYTKSLVSKQETWPHVALEGMSVNGNCNKGVKWLNR